MWTYVAGLLVAVEHLNHVMARVALLDVHLEFWIVLGFLFLLLDRRWIDRRTPEWVPEPGSAEPDELAEPADELDALGFGPAERDLAPGVPAAGEVVIARRAARRVPSPIWRPWRFAAGAALGAAVAVKWSGVTALGAAVLLSYIWETSRRTRGDLGRWRAFGRTIAVETFGLALAFAIVPFAVYMVTWLPWFNHFGWSLKAWWENQTASWDYHRRPHRVRARLEDGHVHAHAPVLLEGVEVDPDAAAGLLLRARPGPGHPADPLDREPDGLLVHARGRSRTRRSPGGAGATGTRGSWSCRS